MIGRKPDIEKILIFEMHCEMRTLGCEMRAASSGKQQKPICCACTKHMRFLLYDRAKARHRENFNFRDALRNADLGLRNAGSEQRKTAKAHMLCLHKARNANLRYDTKMKVWNEDTVDR